MLQGPQGVPEAGLLSSRAVGDPRDGHPARTHGAQRAQVEVRPARPGTVRVEDRVAEKAPRFVASARQAF